MKYKYKVPCTWSMTGEYTIEADSVEDAIAQAGHLPLPDDAQYLHGSFEVFEYEIEQIDKPKEESRP